MLARLAMIVGFTLAVLLGTAAGGALTSADGWRPVTVGGLACGPLAGGLLLVGCLAGAIGLGLLAGVFTPALWAAAIAAAGLAAVGLHGGSVEGLLRATDAPVAAAYAGMAAELAVGALLWLGGLAVIERVDAALQQRLPQAARPPQGPRLFAWAHMATMNAGLICAVVAAAIGFVLLRDPDPKQAVGGLIIAFMLGGLAAQTAYPRGAATGMLLSPALVGLAAYAWFAWQSGPTDVVLADLYARRLLPLALAMPLHYLGAGTLGCVLGIAWAKALAGEQNHEPGASVMET